MALQQNEIEQVVSRAVALYNRLKSPEITAKLVLATKANLTVSFSGSLCYGCGVFDFVEGFAQQLKALTSKFELRIDKTRQINPRTFEADYAIKTK